MENITHFSANDRAAHLHVLGKHQQGRSQKSAVRSATAPGKSLVPGKGLHGKLFKHLGTCAKLLKYEVWWQQGVETGLLKAANHN